MLEEGILRDIIHSTRDGVVVTRREGDDNPIIFVNPAFETLTGYSADEIIGQDCRFLQGEDFDQESVRELSSALKAGRDAQVVLKNYRKDGTPFWNELSVSPVNSSTGEGELFVGIQKDVTRRVELATRLEAANVRLKQINEKLETENKIDALTHTYNRKVLDEEVHMLWRTAKRVGGSFAVIYIDLDDFKQINDEHGHDTGDACLVHLADMLTSKFRRESDVVVRLGGEEFLVASFGADASTALGLANQILKRLASRPCLIPGAGLSIRLQASAGVAACNPDPDEDLFDLINEADEAMFEAKKRGKNRAVMARPVAAPAA